MNARVDADERSRYTPVLASSSALAVPGGNYEFSVPLTAVDH